jgi:hypothetical protein
MAYTYTEAEFDDVKAMYAADVSLEDIQAKHTSKSVASIRMKLVKAGLYKAAVKSSTKTTSVAKEPVKPKSTSKAAMLADFKAAWDAVGPAPF